MNEEKWQRAKEIFAAALELPEVARSRFLMQECENDPELLQLVESLLRSDAKAGSFIATPISSLSLIIEEEQIGKLVGPYRIQKLLGHGGMGAVYMAARADEQFQQHVAIKLIKRGMDSVEIVRRFRHERQILASLDHPNIARLLDGGMTEEGLPYFVMEYIAGEPLDAFCDARRLNTAQRLGLFRQVCAAVQYAHQHLIVHRDLKPSNILVTQEGIPKLLDFGIAKLLHPDLAGLSLQLSKAGMQIMTPEYASPEQVKGEPIHTTSDVYSLGVLLYELLTGHRPYRLERYVEAEIRRVVCEEVPEKPSTAIDRVEGMETPLGPRKVTPETVSEKRDGRPELLRKKLRGDVDNIVLMALRKEPQRRYASVEQFAEDVARHLEGQPVRARKDTFAYRAQKFALRHRVGLAAVTIILLTLVGGIVGISWQARIARAQRDLAMRTANAMIYDLAEGLEQMVGPTESRVALLTKAAKVFEEITASGLATAELRGRGADAHRVLSQTYRILGERERSLHHSLFAEKQARALRQEQVGNVEYETLLASILTVLGDVRSTTGDDTLAQKHYDEAIALYEATIAKNSRKPEVRANLAILLSRRGDRQYYEGSLEQAQLTYARGVQLMQEVRSVEPNAIRYYYPLAAGMERLGDVFYAQGKIDSSCVKYREALAVRREEVAATPNDPRALRGMALGLQNVGWCAEQEENLTEALTLYDESIAILRRLMQHDTSNTLVISNLIGGLATRGNALFSQHDFSGAMSWYREALALGKQMQAAGKSEPSLDSNLASIAQMLGDALTQQKRFAEASQALTFAWHIMNNLSAKDPDNLEFTSRVADALSTRGDLALGQLKFSQALKFYEDALALRRRLSAATGFSEHKQKEADSCYKYALGLRKAGQIAEARAMLLRGQNILLTLRTTGELSDTSEGFRLFLPAIDQALRELPR